MNQQAALLLEMRKHKTSHVLHLILSILTAGIWVFVAISNSIENAKLDRKIEKLLLEERLIRRPVRNLLDSK